MEVWILAIGGSGVIVAIAVPVILSKVKKKRHRKTYFQVVWGKASDLKPVQILGIRAREDYGYRHFYYERDIDERIRERIEKGEHVLVVGNPLAGKTRAIYQALKSLEKRACVLVPALVDIRPEEFVIPGSVEMLSSPIVFLDDIDKFAARQNFDYMFGEFKKKDITIVATCRSGEEYKRFCEGNERIAEAFKDPIEIKKIEKDEAEEIRDEADLESLGEFDGNIGSMFVPIETMRKRYESCTSDEKAVLISIRRLYEAGIYEGHEVFSADRIKLVAEKCEGVKKSKPEWRTLIGKLDKSSFIESVNGDIKVEEVYLQKILERDFVVLDNFRELVAIFSGDADASFNLGGRAYDIGLVDIARADYEKIAVSAYLNALAIWTLKDNRHDYAMTQNNLGNAYQTLGEVEDKAANCKKAIAAFSEALKVRTLEDFPIQYAMTQNNLGNAYQTLGEVEDKASNCKRAIAAYNEALKVYTLEDFPMDYAMTQNNLGAAYRILGDVEEKAANCKKAIAAYGKALKIRTLEDFPMDYAMTQNNLGNAYRTLGEAEDKADNCKKAIAAYNEALKVRTLKDFPIQYAMTQENLGIVYGTLSEAGDRSGNCAKARAAIKEAIAISDQLGMVWNKEKAENNLAWLESICGDGGEE